MTVLGATDKAPIHDFDRQGNLVPVSLRKRTLESTPLRSRRVWAQFDRHRVKDGAAS